MSQPTASTRAHRRPAAEKGPRKGTRRGIAAVQFAVALTLIFLLFVGAVEYSRIHMLQHTVHEAAYHAARAATAPGCSANDARAAAANCLRRAGVRFANITISPQPILESTPSVRVQIALPLPQNSWVMPRLTQGGVLYSEATLLTDRPAPIQREGLPKPPPQLTDEPLR